MLDVELAGAAAGTDYDQLAVAGTIALAGTLRVTLVDGFVPVGRRASHPRDVRHQVHGRLRRIELPLGIEAT